MCSFNFVKAVKYIEGYDFGEFFNYENADLFINYMYAISPECQQQKWHCFYGATKMVIVFDDENFVIKIPFNSTEDYCYGERTIVPFCGAPAPSCWDYCEVEQLRYEDAKVHNFEKFVAKTTLVYITKNDIRIYTQPKCETCYNCEKKTCSKKNFEFFRKWYKGCLPIDNINWLNCFIDNYGLKTLKAFCRFLEVNDWADDFSSDNLGFCNGLPVLIDYSSYWE